MGISTADLSSLWFIKESTWGVTPGSGNLNAMRLLSESLSGNLETKVSEEIRPDRTTTDVVPVGQDAGGSLEFELSFGSFDDFIAAAMFNSFVTDVNIVGVAADISTVNATGKITSTLAGKFSNLSLGQSFRLKGFTTNSGENNLIYKITTYTSNQDITVVPAPPSDETPAGTAAEIHVETVTNGVTAQSFSGERRLPDATAAEYFQWTGVMVASWTLDFGVGDLLKGNFELLAKGEDTSQAKFTGLTDVPALTSDIFNSVSNLKNVLINDVASSQSFLKLGMTLSNNLRGLKAIGSLSNIAIAGGSIDLTGPIEIYFQDAVEFVRYKNGTPFSLSFSVEDSAGNAYVFAFPKCKYENLTVAVEGKNNSIIAKGTWRALLDSTQSIMVRIDKLDSSL